MIKKQKIETKICICYVYYKDMWYDNAMHRQIQGVDLMGFGKVKQFYFELFTCTMTSKFTSFIHESIVFKN